MCSCAHLDGDPIVPLPHQEGLRFLFLLFVQAGHGVSHILQRLVCLVDEFFVVNRHSSLFGLRGIRGSNAGLVLGARVKRVICNASLTFVGTAVEEEGVGAAAGRCAAGLLFCFVGLPILITVWLSENMKIESNQRFGRKSCKQGQLAWFLFCEAGSSQKGGKAMSKTA